MLNGRKQEIALLEGMIHDRQSHFLAIYGRGRVGKTVLIRETFGDRFTFHHTGLLEGTLQEQLAAFDMSLRDAGFSIRRRSRNWLEAFDRLKSMVENTTEKRKILFVDELSMMDTPRCDLMRALEHFWNGWASARKDIILIICSSATSWMLSKVIHNKGGLYNRLTKQIHLHPFTLKECETYAAERGLSFTREQVLQCYMVMGGIPYYWSLLEKGYSLPGNIDRIFFAKDAPLKKEFQYLYASIFRNPAVYIRLIRALAKKKAGMTREELIAGTGITNSGDLSAKLAELESCDFIRRFHAFGTRKKNAVYQLTDFFTLFYFQFLESGTTDPHYWTGRINTPKINTWSGLSFERICFDHVEAMKKALGISGVSSEISAWYCKADPERGLSGSQIDLLIARKDGVINLCEMKYANSAYTITKSVDADIRRKTQDFRTATKTRSAIHPTLITCHGVVDNAYAGNLQAIITLNDLFV